MYDTKTVLLGEDVDTHIAREVLPHVPDAWVDKSKLKVGCEILLNGHISTYEPPRPLVEAEANLWAPGQEIAGLLSDIVRS